MYTRAITFSLAIAITATSVFMSVVAAIDRSGTTVDQILLVALSVSVTLLVHFLPSVTKNKMVLIVWGLCLLAALFNHLNFFVHSSERADAMRAIKADDSIQVRGMAERISDISHNYVSIGARSETEISHDLATATGWKLRAALHIELDEARRKIQLSNQLAALKSELARNRETAGNDLVMAEISSITGISGITVSVVIGLFLAVLIELSGALLWNEILHGQFSKKQNVSTSATEGTKGTEEGNAHKPILMDAPILSSAKVESTKNVRVAVLPVNEDKDVIKIITALNEGKCQLTAASIRDLLKCRTSRAAELNRQVKALTHQVGMG